jgi:hypothetical protein
MTEIREVFKRLGHEMIINDIYRYFLFVRGWFLNFVVALLFGKSLIQYF